MTPRTFQIKSFGCQMNVYDGERMAELLSAHGMSPVADRDEPDPQRPVGARFGQRGAAHRTSSVARVRRASAVGIVVLRVRAVGIGRCGVAEHHAAHEAEQLAEMLRRPTLGPLLSREADRVAQALQRVRAQRRDGCRS